MPSWSMLVFSIKRDVLSAMIPFMKQNRSCPSEMGWNSPGLLSFSMGSRVLMQEFRHDLHYLLLKSASAFINDRTKERTDQLTEMNLLL